MRPYIQSYKAHQRRDSEELDVFWTPNSSLAQPHPSSTGIAVAPASMRPPREIPAKQKTLLHNAETFSPASLRDPIAVETFVGTLECLILSPRTDKLQLVSELIAPANLFEFAISAIVNEDTATTLTNSILDTFPTSAKEFLPSLASKLLSRLSQYFWVLNYPVSGLKDSHRAVDLAYTCFQAVSGLSLASASSASNPAPETNDWDDVGFGVGKKKSQKQQKKERRANRVPLIDPKPFDNIEEEVPQTKEELDDLVNRLLDDQAAILRFYFQVLRMPELAKQFRKAYITNVVPQGITATTPKKKNVTATAESTQGITADKTATHVSPMIQPIKAALYFGPADGFGPWRIYISTRADGNLRDAWRRDPQLFKVIVKKIKELSNGHFSDDNHKKINVQDSSGTVPVFEAKMTRDTRLVYHIDCVKEFDSDIETQVIRVFGVYTHAQLNRRLWQAVGNQLTSRGREYRRRCNFRSTPRHPGDKVVSPACFPTFTEIPSSPEEPLRLPELQDEERQELHSLLVLEKFVTFSQAFLSSILANQDVAHVFQMSPQEQDIVQHSSSCYVLGRSGTGKTTTMIFKMLGIERSWELLKGNFHDEAQRPRQLFVTQSVVLAEKVREYYQKLSRSLAAEQRSLAESAGMNTIQEQHGLVDLDEEEQHHGELPSRFGELEDKHFPLFLTYNQLCRLLTAELRYQLETNPSNTPASSPVTSIGTRDLDDYMLQQLGAKPPISDKIFQGTYWNHFPSDLVKRMDRDLVFSEFMGVVKGSEQTLHSDHMYLTREEYLGLSHRTHATFSTQRESIYQLFQTYQTMSARNYHYDVADRTHAIAKNLVKVGLPTKVDFIYVDEVQDNLLIDTFVLRSICRNPNGLFWAGDTAQTISAGSSFRFDDLKAFLYRLEKTANGGVPGDQPKQFQLTVNYRSHNGIVRCAHSVVSVITHFWPNSIDMLAEEKGVIDGLRPVIFTGWNADTVRYEQFLFGGSGDRLEFGAKQCILVRDEDAKERLREQVGTIGNILTLYESKGLEFDDVLLYNFFEDSMVDFNQWRVILNILPKQPNCPRFDEARHNVVCRELKFLYVAITRARQNLWIADCSDRRMPMQTIWDSKGQVRVCKPGDDLPRLAVTSTADEWAETARTLFNSRRFSQAAHAYERANLSRERDVAEAYYLREQAIMKPATPQKARVSAFLKAAEAFLASAATSTTGKERRAYHRIAAECFVEVEEDGKAAKSYLDAEEYEFSARFYRKAGMFDEAVAVIKQYSRHIPKTTSEKIISVAKIHYVTSNELTKATDLFDSYEDTIDFLKDYEFDMAHAEFLEKKGRLTEAADLHFSEGRNVEAIDLLRRDGSEDSLQRAQIYLLEGLWESVSFGVATDAKKRGDSELALNQLLRESEKFVKAPGLSDHIRDQLAMFQTVAYSSRTETDSLRSLGEKFYSKHADPISALLCLDHAFNKDFSFQDMSCEDLVSFQEGFLIYVQELTRIAMRPEFFAMEDIQKLFGIRQSSEGRLCVAKGTFLYGKLVRPDAPQAQDDRGLLLQEKDLQLKFSQLLQERLLAAVRYQNDQCFNAPALSPCLPFTVFGECEWGQMCYSAHVPKGELNVAWFHTRLRAVFQQILVYQAVSSFDSLGDRRRQQRTWLTQLHSALYPPTYKLGSVIHFDVTRILEAEKAVPVIKHWLRDMFLSADPIKHFRFLDYFVVDARLALYFDREAALDYMYRAPCFTKPCPQWLKRKGDGEITHDALMFLIDSRSSSPSAGMLLVDQILEKDLPIHVNTLCQLLEDICASYSVSINLARNAGSSPHNVTLPLTWIKKLSSDGAFHLREARRTIFKTLPPRLGELFERIILGHRIDHLTIFVSSSLGKQKPLVRQAVIARICRAICLVGYNDSNPETKDVILKMTRRLVGLIHLQPFLRQLSQAKHWGGVAKALRDSELQGPTQFDELIALRDKRVDKDKTNIVQVPGTRLIQYRDIPDIPLLLDGKTPLGYSLRAEAEVFVPKLAHKTAFDALQNETPDDDPDDDSQAGEENPEELEGDVEAAISSVDSARVEQKIIEISQQELDAANKIWEFYKRFSRLRRFSATVPPIEEAQRRWFSRCLEAKRTLELSGKYRLLYLGALPHALVCLEKAATTASEVKRKCGVRLRGVEHLELEIAQEEFDMARGLCKKISELQRTLGPTSSLHTRQDVKALKLNIFELSKILETKIAVKIPKIKEIANCGPDFGVAFDSIVTKTERKPALKPTLVVEDGIEMYY